MSSCPGNFGRRLIWAADLARALYRAGQDVTLLQGAGQASEPWQYVVPCRTRFSFGMSTNGKKLYLYGAGFEIEVYDAATLKYERTWDLNNDVTGSMIALP